MTSAVLLAAMPREGTESTEVALPFAPIWFGVIAITVFLLLLAITWAFRNAAAKVGQHAPAGPAHADTTAPHEPGRAH